MSSEVSPSPFDWHENCAWTYEAEVNVGGFQRAINPVAALVDEAKLNISRSGVHIQALDPASVAAVGVTVDCVVDIPDPLSTGVNVYRLTDNWPPYWDRSDSYHLTIDHGTGTDSMQVKHPTEGEYKTDAFDPSLVQNVPNEMPPKDVAFEQDVTLSAPKVRGLLGSLAETDADYIRVTPRSEKITAEAVTADGDTHHDWTISAPGVSDGDYEYYSADYLRKIAPALWPDGEVRVRFGSEQALSLTTGSLQFVQAPRINPKFEDSDDE